MSSVNFIVVTSKVDEKEVKVAIRVDSIQGFFTVEGKTYLKINGEESPSLIKDTFSQLISKFEALGSEVQF